MTEHDLPDLHALDEKIHEARDAEDRLTTAMPNAIQPEDAEYPGVVPTSADNEVAVEEVAQEPEPPEQTASEEVQDAVTEDGDAATEPQHADET